MLSVGQSETQNQISATQYLNCLQHVDIIQHKITDNRHNMREECENQKKTQAGESAVKFRLVSFIIFLVCVDMNLHDSFSSYF